MPELMAEFLEFKKIITFLLQVNAMTAMRFWGLFFIFPFFVWVNMPPMLTMVFSFVFALPALPGMASMLMETDLTIWPITSSTLEASGAISTLQKKQATIINIKEFFLGAMLGFFPAAFFYGFILVGEMVDQARGDIGGRSSEGGSLPMTSCGTIFFLTGSILFITSGEFHHFIRLIYRSYEVWPLFELSGFLTANRLYFFLELSLTMLFSMAKIGIPFLLIMWSFDLQTMYQVKTDKKFQAQEYQFALKNFAFIFFFIFYLNLSDNESYNPTLAVSSTFSVILEGGGHEASNILGGMDVRG